MSHDGILFYSSPHATAFLSTAHPSSSYGAPVVVLAGQALGPADLLPSGVAAGDFVRAFLAKADPGAGRWVNFKRAAPLARKFLGQDPRGRGRPMAGVAPRVPITVTVAPATLEYLDRLAAARGCSRGQVIDRWAAIDGSAERFGALVRDDG